jgi:hypothetical protein
MEQSEVITCFCVTGTKRVTWMTEAVRLGSETAASISDMLSFD